jgi:hypothetical protein
MVKLTISPCEILHCIIATILQCNSQIGIHSWHGFPQSGVIQLSGVGAVDQNQN